MKKPIIYTIGHSNHQIDFFLELLKEYKINCIIDIRSVPASSYNPQYNLEPLRTMLKNHKINYMHFGDEFGARRTDPDLLDDDGKLDFDKVRKTRLFKNGLERIWQGIEKSYIIAIMCSESEPLDCHRFSMVSYGLEKDGVEVKHILKDKSIKSNAELEMDLLKLFEKKLPQVSLFEPDITIEDQLKFAYKLKNKEIGYSPYINYQKEEYYD